MLKHQQLYHALVLREHRNFHRAAEAANISQPAFSRSIGNLEAALGVALFDRSPGGVIPTSHGQSLLERAETIIAETEELIRDADLSKGPNFGELTVAMGTFASDISGAKIIAGMAADFPELNIRVIERDWQSVTDYVQDRTVELGFVNTETIDKDSPLLVETIAQHQPVFFCGNGHPLLSKKKVTEKDLNRFPAVAVRLPNRTKRPFPGTRQPGPKDTYLRPTIEVENLIMARAVVAESDAFSLAAPTQIEAQLQSGMFKVLPISAAKFVLRYGLVTLHGRTLSPAAADFMQRARQIEKGLTGRNRTLLKQYSPVQV